MEQTEKWPGYEYFLTAHCFYRTPQGVLPTLDTQKQPSGYSVSQGTSLYLPQSFSSCPTYFPSIMGRAKDLEPFP